jgi:hypothetical protein
MKVDQHMLFSMILSTNYLNIQNVLDLMCQAVADMSKRKSPKEIRTSRMIIILKKSSFEGRMSGY